MWPFKKSKKADKTNSDAYQQSSILTNSFGTYQIIGANQVTWKRTLTQKQDNLLLIDYFNQLAEVSSPILKYSDNAPNIQPYLVNNEGGIIENHPFEPIIDKFWYENSELLSIYYLLLGNAYIQGFSQITSDSKGAKIPTELYLFPSEYVEISVQQSNIDFRDYKILNYTVDIGGDFKKIVINKPD